VTQRLPRRSRVVHAAALLGLWACGGSGDAAAELAPALRVVLPAASAARWQPCTEPPFGVAGFWTPSDSLAKAVDGALAPVLAAALRRVGAEGRAADYHRQYLGVVIDGRRMVYVNGFHHFYVEDMLRTEMVVARIDTTSPPVGADFWKRYPVGVCDGGAAFFGVVYDPLARRFGAVRFNGYA